MMKTSGSFIPFLTSPISAVFLGIAIVVILFAATKTARQKRKAQKQAS